MTTTPFRAALDALALLAVPGVTNYGITTAPDSMTRAALPALLVLPGETQDDRLFKERGTGYQAMAFRAASRRLEVTVTHLLLTAPVAADVGARGSIPALIDHIDAYTVALGADVTLGGALAAPAAVTIEPGEFRYGRARYHGCAFRHTWALEVTP